MNNSIQELKTKLKFVVSDKTGEMISFVTKDSATKRLRGVRENEDVKKKIVLVSKEIMGAVVVKENILYDVCLKPMAQEKGYLVTSLSITEFEADMVTRNNTVVVGFGNKTITYDPSSFKESFNSIEGVVAVLQDRVDIKDKDLVIAQFEEKAKELSFQLLGAVRDKNKAA